jgi:hypothetical protein
MVEIGAEEMWTPFLEKINQLMVEEKKARQENDSFKGAELCSKIVSQRSQMSCVLAMASLNSGLSSSS